MQGILITARLGSTRLSDKHLKPIGSKPIMQYLLERIQNKFSEPISAGDIKIIIATAAEEQNKRFRRFEGLANLFFGDIRNIPFRHLQAALTYDLESIIAVDGDDILCSPQAIQEVQQSLLDDHDYVTTKGLPFGLNAFGYSRRFLAEALEHNKEKVLETGWGQIFDHQKPEEIWFSSIEEHKNKLRFTLDYEEDLHFFEAIINKLGNKLYDISNQDLTDFVLSKKIYALNMNRIEEYWRNFHSQQNDHE